MSRLFRNIAYNVMGQGLILILGFIGVKFIFSRLGADAFGIIYFNLILTGVLTTALELGVLVTTVREVSAHHADEPGYIEQLIRTASVFYWGIGLVLFVAIFLAAPLLVEKWVNLKTIDPATATTMLRFLSVTALIMLPRALYSSLFQGRQRMELNNSIDVASSAIQQLGTILILARGGDAFAVVEWIAASAIISTLAYMAIVARLFGWRALVPAYFQSVVDRNLRFTAHMGALSVLNMVLLQFDKIVVSKLLPIASVGYYSFVSTLVIRISFAATAVAQAALPSFSSLLHMRDAGAALIAQYRKIQDLVGFGMVPLFAAATFGAMPIYTYLFNRQVAWLLLLPTALLCVGFFMYSTVNVPYTFAVAAGRPDIASRAYVFAVFIVVPVTTTLVLLLGLTGAAMSWIVYELFLYAYMIPRIYQQCLSISTQTWWTHILKVAALAAVTYGLAWVVIVLPGSYSTPALVIAYAVASAAFLVGAFFLIGTDLKQTIVAIPQRLLVPRALHTR
jgi:O-antigen/teichoic acid export membrane protein